MNLGDLIEKLKALPVPRHSVVYLSDGQEFAEELMEVSWNEELNEDAEGIDASSVWLYPGSD